MHAVKFACGSLVVDVLLVAVFELSTPEASALLPVSILESLALEVSVPASVLAPEVSAAESPAFPPELSIELFPVSSPFPLGILSLISL